MSAHLRAAWRKLAASLEVDESSPLDYEGKFHITHRLKLVEGDATGNNHPYFTEPGLVAWVDLDVRPTIVRIAYLIVRPDSKGKGYARRLVEEVYDRWPDAQVVWGDLMHDAMVHLYQEYREREPERTHGGRVR